jgi:hypothetical protein
MATIARIKALIAEIEGRLGDVAREQRRTQFRVIDGGKS